MSALRTRIDTKPDYGTVKSRAALLISAADRVSPGIVVDPGDSRTAHNSSASD